MKTIDKYFGKSLTKQLVGHICGWLIGIVFILSAISKCFSIQGFQDEVLYYLDVYFAGLFRGYSMALCVSLCVFELAVGVMSLYHKTKPLAMLSSVVLLSLFVYLTGENYFNPSIMGSYESCGCFGELIHFTPLSSFLKSVILWLISCCCLYFEDFRYLYYNKINNIKE